MRCVKPRSMRVLDPYSRKEKTVSIPCGMCGNCLANEQDSWAVRIGETVTAAGSFVYDTLTLRDDAIEWIDVSDILDNPDLHLSEQSLHYILDTGYKHPVAYGDKVPVLSKKVFSNWIKRGRENYHYYYTHFWRPPRRITVPNGSGGYVNLMVHPERLKIKYFAVLEYGPKWSRPHVHLIMTGICRQDYQRFFAGPWKKDFGFVKSKYFDKGLDLPACECISRYVSKYVNKGNFESALVKDGLQPKPWRCISNGIGEEYLNRDFFKVLDTDIVRFFKSFTPNHVVSRELARRHRSGRSVLAYRGTDPLTVTIRSRRLLVPLGFDESIIQDFSLQQKLISYTDRSGFKHALPRYYREKIWGRGANYFKYALQTTLLQNAEQRRNQKIQEYASSLERSASCQRSSEAYGLELRERALDMASYLVAAEEQHKAEICNARHNAKLNNHYYRTRQAPPDSDIFNQ